LKTSLHNDEKAARSATTQRPAEARPAAVSLPAQPLRTRLVAACGWPTDAAPVARRRAAKR